jgi:hypothetical protein
MNNAFDFWLGTWEVRARDGALLGRNRVVTLFDGTVLQEHWEGAAGGRGTSLNAFLPDPGVWRQTWVDHQGNWLDLEGGPEGAGMQLRGVTATGAGPRSERITWTPLVDGRLLQVWEQSQDGGAPWQVAFEGFYSRVPEQSPGD